MSKAQVRQAILEYLDPLTSGITGLGAVYPALPKVANEADLYRLQPPGVGTGGIIYMFIEHQVDNRIELRGAPRGGKFRTYQLGLLCVFKSDLPSTVDGQVAFDDFIDSLTAWIGASKTAGHPKQIFSWGEGGLNGGPDVEFEYPVPKTANGGVTLFQAVGRIVVNEFLPT